MTNPEYLLSHGWKKEKAANPFCWRDPRTKNFHTESQAMARQAATKAKNR